MSIGGINNSNSNFLRFSGLATGIDVDEIVKQLMDAERAPLNRLNQKKTILEWRRDNYREMINLTRAFRDEFMDVLKPATNMRSAAAYKKYTAESSDTSVLTATASSTALAGSHSITKITSLASAATTSSTSGVTKELTGSDAAALSFAAGDETFKVNLNGVTKTITLNNNYASAAELVNDLNSKLDSAFGANKLTVTDTGGGVLNFAIDAGVSGRVTLNTSSTTALTDLGFANGASNRLVMTDTLENLALKNGFTFDGGNLTFEINGTPISVSKDATLGQLISTVNSSAANVELKYSELTDQFTITAKRNGAGDNIVVANTGAAAFFGNAVNIAAGTYNNGTDAVFELDGVTVTRNDNTFNIDGITYSLKQLYNTVANPNPTPITVNIKNDVNAVYDNIVNFVERYNDLIDKINGELSEKNNRKYFPLSSEQKKEMSEDEVKLWEDMAKNGLLRSDKILTKFTGDMRRAIYDSISGISGALTEIGISTSPDYKEKGKLVIDETKLKNALSADPEKVQNIFAKESSIAYSPNLSAADRATRYSESGIVHRLYDIIQDNIRVTRDSSGRKGFLIEKAGIVGDLSEFSNLIDKEIDKHEDAISALEQRLWKKENHYYKMFTALEKAVGRMNNQSAWLFQQQQ